MAIDRTGPLSKEERQLMARAHAILKNARLARKIKAGKYRIYG